MDAFFGEAGASTSVGAQFSHTDDLRVQSCSFASRGGDAGGGDTSNRPHLVHRSGFSGICGLLFLELAMLYMDETE